MKLIGFIAILSLLFNLSTQIPQFENCSPDFIARHQDSCGRIICSGTDSFTAVGCGTWQCQEGKTIGYNESNNSKPTPECCGGPVCAD